MDEVKVLAADSVEVVSAISVKLRDTEIDEDDDEVDDDGVDDDRVDDIESEDEESDVLVEVLATDTTGGVVSAINVKLRAGTGTGTRATMAGSKATC